MMSLLLLGLLVAAVLFLLGGLGSLYRYLTRSRLFPQLPRLWKPDLTRTIVFGVLLLVSLVGLFGLGAFTSQDEQPGDQRRDPNLYPTARPTRTRPAATVARGEERMLPPATTATTTPATTAAAPVTTAPSTTMAAPVTTAPAPSTTSTTTTTTTSTTTTTTTTRPAPPTTQAAKPAPKSKYWTVCISSYKTAAAARTDAKRLKDRGLATRIYHVKVKGKGWWYRVCAGRFHTRARAGAQGAAWKRAGVAKSPFPYLVR